MAKATKGQQETVERVMHEFKHGELESSSGDKVTSRRQAVAIALSEAGESKYASPAENRKNLARTKRNERRGATGQDAAEGGRTRDELYDEAKRKDVPGRSRMTKAQLLRALVG